MKINNSSKLKYFIAIPTYNGGDVWRSVAVNIKENAPEGVRVKVIDSSSNDNTALIAKDMGFELTVISGNDFNHGGTRNLAVYGETDKYDVVVFLTQDAIPEERFLEDIISVFEDPEIACAYGRQIPHVGANPIASHARAFNYTDKSYISCTDTIPYMGIKTVFMSNSFSAYRISTFEELGGFPNNTILCEDMHFTARAVLSGFKVAYVSSSVVRHSHNYTPIEEFKRYFDIGVFHTDEPWIRNEIGGAGGEGKRFITSELKFLVKKYPAWIPIAIVNNVMKFLGFKLGQYYKMLPINLIRKFSMHKRYWKDEN
ncbi:TPA: glycosyltransferase [Raoultella ornithinolytica]|uniref:glycosyltransferase n=1 Tax=Raoultella ornithinolytica TaxID=54291 RepID=UPI0004D65C91|nr:glycosyltransferase family 2 protein [Raoultella ornithinolytica]KDV93014.1 glycosyl transferase 2 family protein [Raoultella ornithinolytica 2-156-04_S1_C1]KDX13257.1 glycosyl transferase 2 family protein [Raoultella ornithinolytica 2-156-04_S1_C2]